MTARKDPRKVGGEYYNGYWRKKYTVVKMTRSESGVLRFVVEWEDGTRGSHCTAWDHKNDRIISQP